MILRAEAIRDRLQKLRVVLRNLQSVQAVPRSEFVADFRHYWLAERGLQLASEAIFDIGNHVLAGDRNVSASTYEDVITKLGEQRVISSQLAGRLRGLGGFRNILVHAYLEVDVGRVHEYLATKLGDFRRFAEEMERYLDDRG